MKAKTAGKTDRGKKRKINEDAYFISPEGNLFLVADGMGGHSAGEIASKITVEAVEGVFEEEGEEETDPFGLDKYPPEASKLVRAFYLANAEIYRRGSEDPNLEGMGTTATSVFLKDNLLYISHVGDSRAYLIRNNEIRQLTEDHSWVNEQIKLGLLKKEEADSHQNKNIITRALGTKEKVDVDLIMEKVKKDDILLLCSDGLSNMMRDEEIKNIVVKNKDLEKSCQELVNLANERGGKDNITVVISKVEALSPKAKEVGIPPQPLTIFSQKEEEPTEEVTARLTPRIKKKRVYKRVISGAAVSVALLLGLLIIFYTKKPPVPPLSMSETESKIMVPPETEEVKVFEPEKRVEKVELSEEKVPEPEIPPVSKPLAPKPEFFKPAPPEVIVAEPLAPQPEFGWLSVKSQPERVNVYIFHPETKKREFIGETPLEMKKLPVGKYSLKVGKKGWEEWEKVVEIKINTPEEFNIVLRSGEFKEAEKRLTQFSQAIKEAEEAGSELSKVKEKQAQAQKAFSEEGFSESLKLANEGIALAQKIREEALLRKEKERIERETLRLRAQAEMGRVERSFEKVKSLGEEILPKEIKEVKKHCEEIKAIFKRGDYKQVLALTGEAIKLSEEIKEKIEKEVENKFSELSQAISEAEKEEAEVSEAKNLWVKAKSASSEGNLTKAFELANKSLLLANEIKEEAIKEKERIKLEEERKRKEAEAKAEAEKRARTVRIIKALEKDIEETISGVERAIKQESEPTRRLLLNNVVKPRIEKCLKDLDNELLDRSLVTQMRKVLEKMKKRVAKDWGPPLNSSTLKKMKKSLEKLEKKLEKKLKDFKGKLTHGQRDI